MVTLIILIRLLSVFKTSKGLSELIRLLTFCSTVAKELSLSTELQSLFLPLVVSPHTRNRNQR